MKTRIPAQITRSNGKTRPGFKLKLLSSLCALSTLATAHAAVPSADITLQTIRTDNMPVFVSLSGYTATESLASGTNSQMPLYKPYNNDDPAWWDNLIAEQLQARLPAIMCATRGAWTLSGTDMSGPGNMNPRRLTLLNDALTRAGATSLMKVACFVDTPSARFIPQFILTGSTGGAPVMDMSIASDWNDVFWLRVIKPWFDTIPQASWFTLNNKPVIQFWSMAYEGYWFKNCNGNVSQMLNYVAAQFLAAYGVSPVFILDQAIFSLDPTITVANVPAVIGNNGWFSPPGTSNTLKTYNGSVFGCSVAGFIDPGYYDPQSPNYLNLNRVIYRNNVSGTGANGDTLKSGMDAMVSGTSKLTVLEGWTDVAESAGLYRSEGETEWTFPSQYINIIRYYSDPRTVTLRLEAEACDTYYKTVTGQATGIFRRSGNLVTRTIGTTGTTGWGVTKTNAGEWIQFNSVHCSAGNYKFPIKYASTAAHTLRLYVDGAALPDVSAPSTGGTNTFSTVYLGTKALTHGTHTLKVMFVDGGVDVDWVFVKKYDPLMSFKSALNNCFVTAELGGNATMVSNRTTEGSWERFSVNDLVGAGTVSSTDSVNLQVCNGRYLSAEGSGGGALSPNRLYPGGYETMSIIKVAGSGALVNGDQVVIKTNNGHYVTVQSNGTVDATGTTIGTAQTFTINITAQ